MKFKLLLRVDQVRWNIQIAFWLLLDQINELFSSLLHLDKLVPLLIFCLAKPVPIHGLGNALSLLVQGRICDGIMPSPYESVSQT